MIDQAQIAKLLEFLNLSEHLFLLLPKKTPPDLLLSTLATQLFFKNLARLGIETVKLRESSLFAPKISQDLKKLPKLELWLQDQHLLDEIKTELGRENLIVSFPYQEDQVDKVSYHLGEDSQRFYLTVKPKKGSPPLDSQQVEFAYAGAQAELMLLCGVGDLEELEQLYFGYEELYQSTAIVTLNNFLPDFGTLNLDITGSSSYGEAVFYLIKGLAGSLNLELSSWPQIDLIATLLLSALTIKSNHFSSAQMRSESFLAVAELLQLGARRINLEEAAVVPKPELSKQENSKPIKPKVKAKKKTKVVATDSN